MKKIIGIVLVVFGSMFSLDGAEPVSRKRPLEVVTRTTVGGLKPRKCKRPRIARLTNDSDDEADVSSSEREAVMPRPPMFFTEEEKRSIDETYHEGMIVGRLGDEIETTTFMLLLGLGVPPSTPRGFCSFVLEKIISLSGILGYYDGLILKATDENNTQKIFGVGEETKLEEYNRRCKDILEEVLNVEKGLVYGEAGILKTFYEAKKRGDVGFCELLTYLFEEWTGWTHSWKPAGRMLGESMVLGVRKIPCDGLVKDWYTGKLAMLNEHLSILKSAVA